MSYIYYVFAKSEYVHPIMIYVISPVALNVWQATDSMVRWSLADVYIPTTELLHVYTCWFRHKDER